MRFLIGLVLPVTVTLVVAASFSNKAVAQKESAGTSPVIQKLAQQDRYYNKAIELLENRKKFVAKEIFDPETKSTRKVRMPNYKKAFELLVKSVKTYKNPMAAKKGYELLLTGLLSEKQRRYYPLFAKTMYEHGMCQGYIAWGDVLSKGIYHKVEIEKAKDVYKRGMDVCKKNGKAWQLSIIGTKYGWIARSKKK